MNSILQSYVVGVQHTRIDLTVRCAGTGAVPRPGPCSGGGRSCPARHGSLFFFFNREIVLGCLGGGVCKFFLQIAS